MGRRGIVGTVTVIAAMAFTGGLGRTGSQNYLFKAVLPGD